MEKTLKVFVDLSTQCDRDVFQEYLVRRFEAEALTRSVVELVSQSLQLCCAEMSGTGAFR